MSYKFEILFKGQVPKEEAYPDSIEDYLVIRQDCKVIAVCDGASESYDSKSWAELLSNKYVYNPKPSHDWLLDAIEEYSCKYDFESLSWSKQASFSRGSFSTLLGIQVTNGETVDIFAIGDSVAILVDDLEYITSFPYKASYEFYERPFLVSTQPQHNSFFEEPEMLTHCITWDLANKKSAKIICMTDALAEWALRNNEEGTPVWDKLINVREDSDLYELVIAHRIKKNMKVDDSSLIILELIEG